MLNFEYILLNSTSAKKLIFQSFLVIIYLAYLINLLIMTKITLYIKSRSLHDEKSIIKFIIQCLRELFATDKNFNNS